MATVSLSSLRAVSTGTRGLNLLIETRHGNRNPLSIHEDSFPYSVRPCC